MLFCFMIGGRGEIAIVLLQWIAFAFTFAFAFPAVVDENSKGKLINDNKQSFTSDYFGEPPCRNSNCSRTTRTIQPHAGLTDMLMD